MFSLLSIYIHTPNAWCYLSKLYFYQSRIVGRTGFGELCPSLFSLLRLTPLPITFEPRLFGSRLSDLFDYLDIFLWSRFSWILISCHPKNSKLQIDRLNPFKRLLKQRIIFVWKCDEKFLKQTNMLEHCRVYEYLY